MQTSLPFAPTGGSDFLLARTGRSGAMNRQARPPDLSRWHPGKPLAIPGGRLWPVRRQPGLSVMIEETPQQASDRRLLEGVVQGRADAFAELYDRLSGPLFSLCMRMTGEVGEAEDILQEAFLTIWRRAASYDHTRSSVFSWAVHLTRCKTIDHLRSRGRRLRVFQPPPGTEDEFPKPAAPAQDVAAGTPSASDDAERHEQAVRVRQVLSELPPDQSQAIELSFFSDLSHHEISARLSQPLGTVKARIRRGLLKLRDGLKGL